MQISEGVIRLGLITVRDLHNFSNSDHTRAHSITKSRSFKSPEQGLRRNPPQGRIQDFFRRGWLVSCSTSTPINHIVLFFLQNTSCIRKPQVISRGGGAHPLHPPPRSAPAPMEDGRLESLKMSFYFSCCLLHS